MRERERERERERVLQCDSFGFIFLIQEAVGVTTEIQEEVLKEMGIGNPLVES